jgi:hypothetical protein
MKKSVSRVISLTLCVVMTFSFDLTGIQTAFAAEEQDAVATDTDQSSDDTGTDGTSQDYKPVTLDSLLDEE